MNFLNFLNNFLNFYIFAPSAWDLGSGIWDLGSRIWDLGSGAIPDPIKYRPSKESIQSSIGDCTSPHVFIQLTIRLSMEGYADAVIEFNDKFAISAVDGRKKHPRDSLSKEFLSGIN